MAAPLEFYFDFGSPYGYIGAQRIEALADKHGRKVDWRPMLLGAVFKSEGTQPLVQYPMKGKYSTHDFNRSAREHGIAFTMPTKFPLATIGACRGTYWLKATDPDKAVPFIKAVYAAYFVEDRDISSAEVLAEIAARLDVDSKAFLAGIEQPEIKAKLREVTEDAIQNRGVFGSPFTFVDGEPFWGADRIDQIDRWLSRGGW
jgi:2-hydroxychromene-2-carboxylate isomerase